MYITIISTCLNIQAIFGEHPCRMVLNFGSIKKLTVAKKMPLPTLSSRYISATECTLGWSLCGITTKISALAMLYTTSEITCR